MSKEEFFEKLDKAEEEYSQGKYTTLSPDDSVTDMLRRCGYEVCDTFYRTSLSWVSTIGKK